MNNQFKKIGDFIRFLYHEPNDYIPLHAPIFAGNEIKYATECIESTFVSSVGKYVDRFEEIIARYTGVKKTVACVNGTSALHIALVATGVTAEHEVITQSLTFVATVNAIAYTGATPVFIDVDLDTMGLSPKKLRDWLRANTKYEKTTKITVNRATGRAIAACIPMHTFGHPCRIDEIIRICDEYNIAVVEDATESIGSTYKGKHTGTYSKLGILSFNGNKTITTGGGGMILTNDEELGNLIKHLTTQAKVPHPWEYIHDYVGYNYRMPNINAALGVAQMERIEKIIANKRQTADKYSEFFSTNQRSNDSLIKHIQEPTNSRSNYWLNAILLSSRKERDEFLKYTNENGIMTRPIWKLMNKLEMFRNAHTGNLDNSEWLEDRIVNLPSSVRL